MVNEAHENGSTDQWLMTAAYNVSSILYKYNNKAVITDMKTKYAVLADTIYVVLGWGDDVYGACVDRVAMMSDFCADTESEKKAEVRRRSPSPPETSEAFRLLD